MGPEDVSGKDLVVAEKRRKNESTKHIAGNLARNLVYYARLLKKYPMRMK